METKTHAEIAVKKQNEVIDARRCWSITEEVKDNLLKIMSDDFGKYGQLKGRTIVEVNKTLNGNLIKKNGKN